MNFTNKYTNDSVLPTQRISSWTTFDFNVRYDLGAHVARAWLDNLNITANANNIFDKAPPFAAQIVALGYDPANADPYGRRVSLMLTKAW